MCTEILFEEFCFYSSIALEVTQITGLQHKGFNSNSIPLKEEKLMEKSTLYKIYLPYSIYTWG